VASGQPNENEHIVLSEHRGSADVQISAADPFAGATSSERSWRDFTQDVSALMNPGNNSADGYGETATTKVDHSGGGGYDCLTWSAVIFSAAVADVDHDGLPDGLEDAAAPGLKDPDNQALPILNSMGASSAHKDLFVEVNGMWAPKGTTYGSPNAPFNSTASPPLGCVGAQPGTPCGSVTDNAPLGHNHVPTPEVLNG